MNKKTTFKQKFCEQFNCIEEAFEQVALKQFLPRHWQWLSLPILVVKSRLVAVDIELLERLGHLTDVRSIESFDFQSHYKKAGAIEAIRRLLGFQVSRARVLNFARGAFNSRNKISPQSPPSEFAAGYLRRQAR